jgi:spore germination cell wall hydrolase CwlJ-like protein
VIKLLGSRGASAVMGIFMLAASSSATAQDMASLSVPAAVRTLDAYATAKPLDTSATAKPLDATVQTVSSTLARPAVAETTAVATATGAVLQAQPAQSVTLKLTPAIATEAAWLFKSGWPLYALVDRYSAGAPLDEQANCLATAVYFESRGESVEGQLAVARVVMNRAASGRYPPDWCSVVKQPAQFSFVHHGQFPWVDTASTAWARAQGVARLAVANVIPSVGTDVLWYHANYVAPTWRQRLNVVERIGAHIFYRA